MNAVHEYVKESKVGRKLLEVLERDCGAGSHLEIASAIIRSPDLRVVIVEPRYYVQQRGFDNWFCVIDRNQTEEHRSYHLAHFRLRSHADEYASWLNEEPK